ncbi:MAG: hypothetical protein ACRCX2_37900 [Paraclostridium sp.]
MVAYLAMQIEEGKLTYLQVKGLKNFPQYKEDIDTILITDGYGHLILE